MHIPDYSMFSEKGNLAIHGIVLAARRDRLSWTEVRTALERLARQLPDVYGEATDTAVRECVYESLEYCTDPFYGV